jgi:hypothetical protein
VGLTAHSWVDQYSGVEGRARRRRRGRLLAAVSLGAVV